MEQVKGPAAIDTESVPPGMAAVVGRAIAFDRDARPESPLAFAIELEKTTNGR